MVVLLVLYRGHNVRIDKQELLAHGTAESLQHVALHRLHVLRHRRAHQRRLDAGVLASLLADLQEVKRSVHYGYCIEAMRPHLRVLFDSVLYLCHN